MKRDYIFVAAVSVLCVGVVAAHMSVTGGTKSDRQISNDLSTIYYAVEAGANDGGGLPETDEIDVAADGSVQSRIKLRLQSGEYKYAVTGRDTFTLCANFKTQTHDTERSYPGSMPDFRNHPRGEHCFDASVTLPSLDVSRTTRVNGRTTDDFTLESVELTAVDRTDGTVTVFAKQTNAPVKYAWDVDNPPSVHLADGTEGSLEDLSEGAAVTLTVTSGQVTAVVVD